MGLRKPTSNDHQRVAGKQYFEHEAQFEEKVEVGMTVSKDILSLVRGSSGAGFVTESIVFAKQRIEDGIRKTTIGLDLSKNNLSHKATKGQLFGGNAGDAIGMDGSASCFFADLKTSTIVPDTEQLIGSSMQCIKAGAGGGDGDIILEASATSTTANDAAVSSGDKILDTTGAIVTGETVFGTVELNNDKKFLYLTDGGGGNTAITAGQYILKFETAKNFDSGSEGLNSLTTVY